MQNIICLMGPTAAGKTPLAIDMVQRFPCEIISVDSAMVYREMDIGTAKPNADALKMAPHRLINLVDPLEIYSAGQFQRDVLREINEVINKGKIPLLVGGTMMYFRILQQGLAALPEAQMQVRDALQVRAQTEGWETLHAELMHIDPQAAKNIHPHDSQRIQRALEIYTTTGKTWSAYKTENTYPLAAYRVHNLILFPSDRSQLHERIAARFDTMLEQGLVDEARKLYERGDLHAALPSMRTVGYRQLWAYFSGEMDYETMREKAIIATRQLAKRQLTWLRSWPESVKLASDDHHLLDKILKNIESISA